MTRAERAARVLELRQAGLTQRRIAEEMQISAVLARLAQGPASSRELRRLGGPAQNGNVLTRLVRTGRIVRLSRGHYALRESA